MIASLSQVTRLLDGRPETAGSSADHLARDLVMAEPGGTMERRSEGSGGSPETSGQFVPYDIRVIRARDFLRVDALGQIDFQTSRMLLSDAIWACVHGKIGRVLIDVRGASDTTLTMTQVGMLASICQEVSPPSEVHKIAILNRPKDGLDRAARLAASAQEVGWNIAAFRDFEAAFDWLME